MAVGLQIAIANKRNKVHTKIWTAEQHPVHGCQGEYRGKTQLLCTKGCPVSFCLFFPDVVNDSFCNQENTNIMQNVK